MSSLPSTRSNRVAMVGPCTALSGNVNTLLRIQAALEERQEDGREDGGRCVVTTFDSGALQQNRCDLIASDEVHPQYAMCILLHAYRAGKAVFPDLFRDSCPSAATDIEGVTIPSRSTDVCHSGRRIGADRYVLVLGGTDVHEFGQDPLHRTQMLAVVQRMDLIVCFSEVFWREAAVLWPEAIRPPPSTSPRTIRLPASPCPSVMVVRQGVQQPQLQEGQHNSSSFVDEILSTACTGTTRLVLWCGALRAVKDPMFAVRATMCSEWPPSICLLLVGPVLEECCAREVKQALDQHRCNYCRWHEGVPHSVITECLQDRRVLAALNTSVSEGQSQSLLEAMANGVPVIARDIETNRDLVGDKEERGWLVKYSTQLARTVRHLAGEQLQQANVVHCKEKLTSALQFVQRHHSLETEKEAYRSILLSTMK